ncbi:MAG: 1-phosphofructokinase [Fidelibacterota bacterium]|nr:MAG: 1-phosphofructokinase [Candidatus Neomarinimicrobiota bacterium]
MIYTLTLNPALDRELTVPELAFEKPLRATDFRVDCGGKGFNVSRALAALGEKNVALGFSGGKTGERLEAELESLGVTRDMVRIAGETRVNVSIVTEDHAHYIKANEPGPTITAEEQAALLQKIRTLARAGDWWVLSGSLPPGIPSDFYATVIKEVQSTGARALLDTSGDPLQYGCEATPFLVKPNESEATALTGIKIETIDDVREAAGRIHALGVEIVIISRGRKEALLSNSEQTWLAEPPSIIEHNPIGAGDALIAGAVWGLSHDLAWPLVLRWGVACGAAAAGLDGTAMGSHSQVEQLVPQVQIKT